MEHWAEVGMPHVWANQETHATEQRGRMMEKEAAWHGSKIHAVPARPTGRGEGKRTGATGGHSHHGEAVHSIQRSENGTA
eukprot:221345-Amphidinium_carterae.4